MIHLGDITKINGAEIPVVDCIIGGSPCQDLSIEGKRAGLAGERSGLYMEQIRVVKEMREHDLLSGRAGQFIRPRFMVWENVPGAFSSNKGKDFAAVLEEAVKIAEPKAPPVPVPDKGWPAAGCLVDVDGKWSVGWRVHDAQFWGVPQRRRRIALVCDFGGLTAPEVLFERKSVSWDSSESGQAWKEDTEGTGRCAYPTVARTLTARHDSSPCIEKGQNIVAEQHVTCMATQQGGAEIRTDDKAPTLTAAAGMSGNNQPVVCIRGNCGAAGAISFQERAGKLGGGKGILIQNEKTCALSTKNNKAVFYGISSFDSNAMKSDNQHSGIYEAETSRTLDLNGGNPACNQGGIAVVQKCAVYDGRGNGDGKTVCTITGDHANRITDYTPIVTYQKCTGPLMANSHPGSYTGQDAYNDMLVVHALRGRGNDTHREDSTTYPITNGIVRRLTPLECERLQGYPDGWTDIGAWTDSKGKVHKESSDSARYKALGNSIALPFWRWLLKRISALYYRPATMGSLFDGIGGFPLCWESCNGKGTALWASEIEEFPMAVTKLRFGEKKEDET